MKSERIVPGHCEGEAQARTLAFSSMHTPEAALGNMAAHLHPRWRRTYNESIINNIRFHISNPSRLINKMWCKLGQTWTVAFRMRSSYPWVSIRAMETHLASLLLRTCSVWWEVVGGTSVRVGSIFMSDCLRSLNWW